MGEAEDIIRAREAVAAPRVPTSAEIAAERARNQAKDEASRSVLIDDYRSLCAQARQIIANKRYEGGRLFDIKIVRPGLMGKVFKLTTSEERAVWVLEHDQAEFAVPSGMGEITETRTIVRSYFNPELGVLIPPGPFEMWRPWKVIEPEKASLQLLQHMVQNLRWFVSRLGG